MVGEVARGRPSGSGPPGPQGVAPLDDARHLSERRQPWDRQQAGARGAAAGPVETAQARLAARTGLAWSAPPGQAGGGAEPRA